MWASSPGGSSCSDYVFVPSLLYIFVGNWCQSLIPQMPGWVWILIFIAVNTAINIKGIETTAAWTCSSSSLKSASS